jgi:hypothetical protein
MQELKRTMRQVFFQGLGRPKANSPISYMLSWIARRSTSGGMSSEGNMP